MNRTIPTIAAIIIVISLAIPLLLLVRISRDIEELCVMVLTVVHHNKVDQRQYKSAYVKSGDQILLCFLEFCIEPRFVSANKYQARVVS
jgi:hypothetical protein